MTKVLNRENYIKNLMTLGMSIILTFLLSQIAIAEEDEFQGLPPGEGRELVIEYCTDCHSTKVIIQSRLTYDDWDETVTDMEIEMRDEKKLEKEAEEEIQELMGELLSEMSGEEDEEILKLLGETEEDGSKEIKPEVRAKILDYLSEALAPKLIDNPFQKYRPMPLY